MTNDERMPPKLRGFRISSLVIGLGSWRFLALICFAAGSLLGQTTALYQNDFEKAEIGKAPPDLFVLEGAFTVQEESGNKFLELPGAPLDSFTVLFGPTESSNVLVLANILGTAKGRRFPTFGVGLNGGGGFKLQLSPGKKLLEILKDQEVKASANYEWTSGQWTTLRLQVRRLKDGAWKVEGKAWTKGTAEPNEWMLAYEQADEPPAGRASLFGSPFAGTPIRFDDLAVLSTAHR